jgi:hypothetical protein
MTNVSIHPKAQTSRFNSFIIGAFTAAMLIVAGFLPVTLFAAN